MISNVLFLYVCIYIILYNVNVLCYKTNFSQTLTYEWMNEWMNENRKPIGQNSVLVIFSLERFETTELAPMSVKTLVYK